MATVTTQILRTTEQGFSILVTGDEGVTFGLTGTDRFVGGCTAGGAQLINANWTVPSGKTIHLLFDGTVDATGMSVNDSGEYNGYLFGGIDDNSTSPAGQMNVHVPAALDANTAYTVELTLTLSLTNREGV